MSNKTEGTLEHFLVANSTWYVRNIGVVDPTYMWRDRNKLYGTQPTDLIRSREITLGRFIVEIDRVGILMKGFVSYGDGQFVTCIDLFSRTNTAMMVGECMLLVPTGYYESHNNSHIICWLRTKQQIIEFYVSDAVSRVSTHMIDDGRLLISTTQMIEARNDNVYRAAVTDYFIMDIFRPKNTYRVKLYAIGRLLDEVIDPLFVIHDRNHYYIYFGSRDGNFGEYTVISVDYRLLATQGLIVFCFNTTEIETNLNNDNFRITNNVVNQVLLETSNKITSNLTYRGSLGNDTSPFLTNKFIDCSSRLKDSNDYPAIEFVMNDIYSRWNSSVFEVTIRLENNTKP